MINLTRWEYFKNSKGTFSIFPTNTIQGSVIAEVFTENIADPEGNARLIAASPELLQALTYSQEVLRNTELFMSGQGLESGELNEIIRTVDELLDRVNVSSSQEDL